ncbi:hypothetical protein BH23VER1_BH23VER1_06740 [soil metagenome]
MRRAATSGPALRRPGFTLIEIIVGLAIIALLVGVAIPTISGLQDERRAREPLAELSELILEVRQRAIRERRPYQIAFDATGFHAAPFLHPYGSHAEFLQWLEEIQRSPEDNTIERQEIGRTQIHRENRFAGLFEADERPGAGAGWTPPFVRSYRLPDGVSCQLRSWGDHGASEVEPGNLRRWVFQPTGLVTPMHVTFTRGDAFF